MRRRAAAEVPALDYALKSAAFSAGDCVHEIARLENSNRHGVARLHFEAEIAKLLQPFSGFGVVFFEMPLQWLGDTALVALIVVPDLNRVVSILSINGFPLDDAVFAGVNHRNTHRVAGVILDARRANFFAN